MQDRRPGGKLHLPGQRRSDTSANLLPDHADVALVADLVVAVCRWAQRVRVVKVEAQARSDCHLPPAVELLPTAGPRPRHRSVRWLGRLKNFFLSRVCFALTLVRRPSIHLDPIDVEKLRLGRALLPLNSFRKARLFDFVQDQPILAASSNRVRCPPIGPLHLLSRHRLNIFLLRTCNKFAFHPICQCADFDRNVWLLALLSDNHMLTLLQGARALQLGPKCVPVTLLIVLGLLYDRLIFLGPSHLWQSLLRLDARNASLPLVWARAPVQGSLRLVAFLSVYCLVVVLPVVV